MARGGNGGGRHLVTRLWVIMATSFVDMVGFLIVLPLLPFYALRFGASPFIATALVGVFALAQLATAPLWGRLSDRIGRRPVILGGIVASAASFTLFALADSVVVLLVSRLVQGAAGGTIGVIQAYVTDRAGDDEGAKALGWVTAATSAGVMLGPALGSLAFKLGESAPGFIAAGLCALNFAFAWRWLPEPEREDDGHPAEGEPGAPQRVAIWRSVAAVLLHPASPVASLIWIYAIAMMAFMAMNGVLALYLKEVFGVTEETIGWFYVFVGAVSLVMRAAALGPIVDRLGVVRTMRLGTLCLALGLAAVPLPRSIWSLGLAVMLIPIGTALLFPAVTSLVSRRAGRREAGQTLGVQQTFGGIARGVGPFWAGLLFQHLGIRSPFWVAAGLVGVVGLLALRIEPEERRQRRLAEPAAAEPVEPS
jgi:predicted MFS family arabinose efflux permease